MAKKKEKVELDNIELRPQVIGTVYQKKSNLGRVIFIFIAFILAVYYINDISLFINNLLGRQTAETIRNPEDNKDKPNNNEEAKEVVFNIFSETLSIEESGLVLNNFKKENDVLTFDANNNNSYTIDLSNRKYYLEIYSSEKTLLERFKLDFNSINVQSKISFSFTTKNDFYYIVVVEKTKNDYPEVSLPNNNGVGLITCTKGFDTITYTFRNNELYEIVHTISDSNISDEDYYNRYTANQLKSVSYNNIEGITTTFNSTAYGYTLVIKIDLEKANLSTINEKYYYNLREVPKVVKFEMPTYGFVCN